MSEEIEINMAIKQDESGSYEYHRVSATDSNGLLCGITPEEKRVLQNNVDDYVKLNLIMSRHSLDIIQKLLDAC